MALPVSFRRANALRILAVALLLAGCVEERVSSVPPEILPSLVEQPQADVRTLRDEFRGLATRVPGFAGLWLDDASTIVINLAAPELTVGARGEIARWFVSYGRPELQSRPIRIQTVAYAYPLLLDYLEEAKRAVAHWPGVQAFGVDDRTARLQIGVVDSMTAVEVRAELQALDFPADVWTVEVYGRIHMIQAAGLQSRFDTLVAGIQTSREYHTSLNACSIGFLGFGRTAEGWRDPDVRVYTTAAHCTAHDMKGSNEIFYQPSAVSPGRQVGRVIDKAEVFAHGTWQCGSYQWCRWADVAVIRLDSGVPYLPGATAISTSTTPPNNPPYQGWRMYTGTGINNAIVGDHVTKVGRSGGQTAARVDASCEDIESQPHTPGLWTLCSMRATLGAKPGDSGGVVYIHNPTVWWAPAAAGVLHAAALNGWSWFSSTAGVNTALGNRYELVF